VKIFNIIRTLWDYTKLSIERNTGIKLMGDSLENMFNFRRLSETLITAGQPTEQQLAIVHSSGYQLVVNLAMGKAYNALADEQATVESLGMRHVHIPVDFDQPSLEDFDRFCVLLKENGEQPVLVHCAANFRVSAFMYIYRRVHLGWSEEEAIADLHKIWTPNEVWQRFIDEAISKSA
jgi:protein tyrosine phosphatase (PTP) superfamily phosphohydrolase (DUF442 family)